MRYISHISSDYEVQIDTTAQEKIRLSFIKALKASDVVKKMKLKIYSTETELDGDPFNIHIFLSKPTPEKFCQFSNFLSLRINVLYNSSDVHLVVTKDILNIDSKLSEFISQLGLDIDLDLKQEVRQWAFQCKNIHNFGHQKEEFLNNCGFKNTKVYHPSWVKMEK